MLSTIAKQFLMQTPQGSRSLVARTASCLYSTQQTPSESSANPENPESQQQQAKAIDPAEFKALEERLAKAEAGVLDFKDRYMRALAETENVRVRMTKGIDDAKSFGIQGFCKDLLEVADILNLAVVNTNPAKDVNASMTAKEVEEKLNSMYGGLVMTEKCLLKIFERNHLMQIEPAEGDKFDPNFHDAIFRVPIPGKQSGTVNVCTKRGFKLKERVIRAAQVGVVQ